MYNTPKVTLMNPPQNVLELVYAIWQASKTEDELMDVEDVKKCVFPREVEKLFRAVIAQRIPVGEHIDFVFMLENVSVSFREQMVRHRIGTKASPERVGSDIVMEELPNLADSSWWSQCFTGDTKIKLLNGESKTLKELSKKSGGFWVYSCTKDGQIVPGCAHSARKTGHKEVCEVELDNGQVIRCTLDHLWMRRDGTYIEAKNMVEGESLMPLHKNHKVIAIKMLGVFEDVYDITVDEFHNFALGAGVFVHNSMRIQNMGKFADNKQYRMPESILNHPNSEELRMLYDTTMASIQQVYNLLVKTDIPMEDAREIIPLGAQHRISWKLNLGALQHIVGKRSCWILQLGIWGPIIKGMVNELATKVHPIFREIVTPPCIKNEQFGGCVYHEECERRLDGRDKLPPCPLHYNKHINGNADFNQDTLPMYHEMVERAKEYEEFWGRNPYTGLLNTNNILESE